MSGNSLDFASHVCCSQIAPKCWGKIVRAGFIIWFNTDASFFSIHLFSKDFIYYNNQPKDLFIKHNPSVAFIADSFDILYNNLKKYHIKSLQLNPKLLFTVFPLNNWPKVTPFWADWLAEVSVPSKSKLRISSFTFCTANVPFLACSGPIMALFD